MASMESSHTLTRGDAVISKDGRYRYLLERSWSDGPTITFVMLNPSTADAAIDDPTIRRCIGFAKKWGGGRLRVVNLYALRATDPKELWIAKDAIGEENDAYLLQSLQESELVIAAWGIHAKHERVKEVLDLVGQGKCKFFVLGLTKSGSPRHPLYVRSDASLQPLLLGY